MIIDKSIKRITVGSTDIQKIMSGGVFYGRNPLYGKFIKSIQ